MVAAHLFTGLPRETVRKGYEQHSDRRFCRYTEGNKGRKVPFRWLVRLRCRRIRDFSDSLYWRFSETQKLSLLFLKQLIHL